MREYFMVMGCVFAQTISFCASYKIIFNRQCARNKNRVLIFVFGMLLIHGLLVYLYGWKNSYEFTFLTQLLVPILLVNERGLEKFVQFLFISVASPLLGILPLNIISYIQIKPIYYYLDSLKWVLTIELIAMTIIILIYTLVRKRIYSYNVKISNQGYLAILMVVFSSLLLIGTTQEMSRFSDIETFGIIGLASSLACIVPVIVVIWLIRTEQKRSELEIRTRLSNELLTMQKKYNQSIVANNEQLRKFRHDFKGHIQVIQEYCKENNIDKMKEYLNKMVSKSLINDVFEYTGNAEIDAIIRPLVKRCEEMEIEFKIRGFLPNNIKKLDIFDICSIFLNLLNNAVEECERLIGKEAWVYLEVGTYNDCLHIFIKNSAEKQKNVNDIYTQKKDTRNHGIGLKNVKMVVEKYDGEIKIQSTSDAYSVEIIV